MAGEGEERGGGWVIKRAKKRDNSISYHLLEAKNRAKEGGEIKENAVISKKCDIGRGR